MEKKIKMFRLDSGSIIYLPRGNFIKEGDVVLTHNGFYKVKDVTVDVEEEDGVIGYRLTLGGRVTSRGEAYN